MYARHGDLSFHPITEIRLVLENLKKLKSYYIR